VYQNVTIQQQDFFSQRFRTFFEGKRDVQFDSVVHVFETRAGLDIQWEFTPRRFDRQTVRIFAEYFRAILLALAAAQAEDSLERVLQGIGTGVSKWDQRVAEFDF